MSENNQSGPGEAPKEMSENLQTSDDFSNNNTNDKKKTWQTKEKWVIEQMDFFKEKIEKLKIFCVTAVHRDWKGKPCVRYVAKELFNPYSSCMNMTEVLFMSIAIENWVISTLKRYQSMCPPDDNTPRKFAQDLLSKIEITTSIITLYVYEIVYSNEEMVRYSTFLYEIQQLSNVILNQIAEFFENIEKLKTGILKPIPICRNCDHKKVLRLEESLSNIIPPQNHTNNSNSKLTAVNEEFKMAKSYLGKAKKEETNNSDVNSLRTEAAKLISKVGAEYTRHGESVQLEIPETMNDEKSATQQSTPSTKKTKPLNRPTKMLTRSKRKQQEQQKHKL